MGIPTLDIITDRNDLDDQLYGTFARRHVAQAINAGLTILYWEIGPRIRQDILEEKRAAYGAEILQTLSAKLTVEFGRWFSQRNLASMVRFAQVFSDEKIVATLSQQLGWTHFNLN